MPAKSRRNRRPQAKRAISGQGGGNIATSSDSPLNTPTSTEQGNQFASPNNRTSKAVVPEAPVGSYFLNEVKWITIVTVIIVILLIASYYIFR